MNHITSKRTIRSVYSKMIICFVLVLLVVTVVILLIIYRSERILLRQYVASAQTRAETLLGTFEREYSMVCEQVLGLFSDSELETLSLLPQVVYNRYTIKYITNIKDRIARLARYSAYVDDIIVFLPRQKRQISTGFYYQPINERQFDSLLTLMQIRSSGFLDYDGALYTCYGKFYNRSRETGYDFVIAIRWNVAAIHAQINELYEPDGTGGAELIGSPYGGFSTLPVNERGSAWMELYRYGVIRPAEGSGTRDTKFGQQHFVWVTSTNLATTLLVYQNEVSMFPWLRLFRLYNWGIMLIITLCAAIFIFMMRKVVSVPMRTLKAAVARHELDMQVPKEDELSGDDFGQLFESYQHMIRETAALQEENYQQQILVKAAQVKQLQSQINPHFLFNSLLCASSLIKAGEDDEAVDMISHLSKYYEYITREAGDDRTLMQEHSHIQDYLTVQGRRFLGRIRYDIQEPPVQYREMSVPRLILQPIVENCFSHAFFYMSCDALLSIRYEREGEWLLVCIENNGALDESVLATLCSMPDEIVRESEISGLVNVHLRLKYRFGPNSGLMFRRGELGGLEVLVCLPAEGGMGHV